MRAQSALVHVLRTSGAGELVRALAGEPTDSVDAHAVVARGRGGDGAAVTGVHHLHGACRSAHVATRRYDAVAHRVRANDIGHNLGRGHSHECRDVAIDDVHSIGALVVVWRAGFVYHRRTTDGCQLRRRQQLAHRRRHCRGCCAAVVTPCAVRASPHAPWAHGVGLASRPWCHERQVAGLAVQELAVRHAVLHAKPALGTRVEPAAQLRCVCSRRGCLGHGECAGCASGRGRGVCHPCRGLHTAVASRRRRVEEAPTRRAHAALHTVHDAIAVGVRI